MRTTLEFRPFKYQTSLSFTLHWIWLWHIIISWQIVFLLHKVIWITGHNGLKANWKCLWLRCVHESNPPKKGLFNQYILHDLNNEHCRPMFKTTSKYWTHKRLLLYVHYSKVRLSTRVRVPYMRLSVRSVIRIVGPGLWITSTLLGWTIWPRGGWAWSGHPLISTLK